MNHEAGGEKKKRGEEREMPHTNPKNRLYSHQQLSIITKNEKKTGEGKEKKKRE